jgi:hypothetical protein
MFLGQRRHFCEYRGAEWAEFFGYHGVPYAGACWFCRACDIVNSMCIGCQLRAAR